MVTREQRDVVQEAKIWPVRSSRAGLLGLGGAALLLLVSVATVAWGIAQPSGPGLLAGVALASLSAAAAAVFLVYAVSAVRLRYRFTPDALVVQWSGPTEAIPYGEIDGIFAGQRIGHIRRLQGVSFPGYYVGLVRSRTLGLLRVFATARDVDTLSVIVAGNRTLVLTPSDPAAFRRELIRRIEASQSSDGSAAPVTAGRFRIPDPVIAAFLAASVVLLGAGLGDILAHYQALPELIPLRPEAIGRPGQLSPRSDIYSIPLLGTIVLLVNFVLIGVFRRERAAVFLLASSGVLVEAILLLGTVRLLS